MLFGGSKNCGKSFLGISIIFSSALIYAGTRWLIARKHLTDLRRFTTPDIISILRDVWKLPDSYWSYNGSEGSFHLYNGSIVYLLDADKRSVNDDFSRFGSLNMTGCWLEECSEIDELAKNAIIATVGRCKNREYGLLPKCFMTCNPANNWLFTDFYKPWIEGRLEGYKAFIQALPTDNKTMTKEYYESLERTLTNNQKQRLLYGRWEFDDNPNLLVSYEAVQDCFTNTPSYGIRRISADIARSGRDKAVITSWEWD